MDSGQNLKLPIIDFSDLKHGTPMWESVKRQVSLASQEYGAFEVIFNEIPQSLRESISELLEQLFGLPLENKSKISSNSRYRGYVASPYLPLFEGLVIEDALAHGNIETFTNLLWPQGNPTFSQKMQSFLEQLSKLDQMVRKMVLEMFGLQKYEDRHMESTNYLVRVQKYDGPRSNETKVGLVSHTDKNLVSILHQNEVKGLQLLIKDEEWITVEPSHNSYVVIFGECFNAWTNGRTHSAHHRVMMTGDITRYSMGLFSIPKNGYMIKAPDEMVDEDHPLLFKPFDYAEFRTFFTSKEGMKCPLPLKKFCGV